MNRLHALRITDANFLETRLHRQTLVEQEGSHRAVSADDALLEFIEEVHVVNAGLRSRSAAVNSLGSGRQLPSPNAAPVRILRFTCELESQLLQGRMAKTRAGKPEPPFGFGKLMTTIAPNSGT
jgi:hypothetical protein